MDAAALRQPSLAHLAETAVILRLLDAVARRSDVSNIEQPPACAFLSQTGEPTPAIDAPQTAECDSAPHHGGTESAENKPSPPLPSSPILRGENDLMTPALVAVASPPPCSARHLSDEACERLRDVARQAQGLHESLLALLRSLGAE